MSEVSSTVSCRLCGAQEARIYHKKDGYSILRCCQCDLVYLDHPTRPDSLRDLYSAEYFHDDGERQGYHDYCSLQTSITTTAKVRLKHMARFCSRGSLLEIGCAMGFFLQAAQHTGWEVQGVELSDYAAKMATERFSLPVIAGCLEDARFPATSFDAVAMWDVIEHVPNPLSLMREVARVLRRGGLVALSTGDVESLLARLSGSRWHLYNLPQHLSFFSPTTIARLLEVAGLRVRKLRHDGAMYTLDYITHRLNTVHPNRLTSWLYRVLRETRAGHWGVWLNTWDIMTVFATKD